MRDLLQRLSAPPKQTLRILQPTPYTVSYTVSTRPVPRTVLARVTSFIGFLLRVTAGLSTTLLLWLSSGIRHEQTEHVLLHVLSQHHLDQLYAIVTKCQWMYLGPCALVIFIIVFRRNYTEESLTVLRGLGIQTSTISQTYLQAPTTRFIPTTSIQDIFIYEAFKGFEVRFYLAVVVEGEEKVVVVFPGLLPKRAILEEVWRGARKCLWEGKDEKQQREVDGVEDKDDREKPLVDAENI
ncbi:GPI-GlcNAc transferase complex, PIG-H component-domain-containing protein [Phaeosphaeria sp. MPI-PUGE-AT-0046c]|nr:GPI-GlcNAc transferase complex, PIG-H component-domain-containing protein [Phaeosphaeria sp. MPI-PUGE-AT-0046c]